MDHSEQYPLSHPPSVPQKGNPKNRARSATSTPVPPSSPSISKKMGKEKKGKGERGADANFSNSLRGGGDRGTGGTASAELTGDERLAALGFAAAMEELNYSPEWIWAKLDKRNKRAWIAVARTIRKAIKAEQGTCS